MGSFPCGCEGRKWVFGPCGNGRSQGKPSTCFLCSCQSLREILLYRTCSAFRIVNLWSFLANLPRYEENDSEYATMWKDLVPNWSNFLQSRRLLSVWGISEPCNASIQSSRCWETFPTIKSILRIHAAIKTFPTQVPIKLLLNSKSFQPHSCPMCLYECKRKSEYSIRLNSRSLACLPGPQLYGKTPVWMCRV